MCDRVRGQFLRAVALCALLCAGARAAGPAPTAEEDTYDLRQVLLRSSSVTVSPGAWQWDASLDYTRLQLARSDGGKSTHRSATFDNNLRLGVTERLQVFGGLPLVYAVRETTDPEGFHEDSVSGIGDPSLGLSVVIAPEGASFPGTVFTLAATYPSGESPYDGDPQFHDAFTGSGHTRVRGEVDFVRSSDPVVLYWGLGYEYFDSASGWDHDIEPGGAIHYRFGAGFSVNRDTSLLAELLGAYQFESSLDGETVDGSQSEPVSMKVGVTARLSRDLYIEPAAILGITEDAPDLTAGATLVRRGVF